MSKDKTRRTRSKAQIAQDELDVATRLVEKTEARITAAKQVVTDLESDLKAAVRRRDYAALNPDLPVQAASNEGGDPETSES